MQVGRIEDCPHSRTRWHLQRTVESERRTHRQGFGGLHNTCATSEAPSVSILSMMDVYARGDVNVSLSSSSSSSSSSWPVLWDDDDDEDEGVYDSQSHDAFNGDDGAFDDTRVGKERYRSSGQVSRGMVLLRGEDGADPKIKGTNEGDGGDDRELHAAVSLVRAHAHARASLEEPDASVSWALEVLDVWMDRQSGARIPGLKGRGAAAGATPGWGQDDIGAHRRERAESRLSANDGNPSGPRANDKRWVHFPVGSGTGQMSTSFSGSDKNEEAADVSFEITEESDVWGDNFLGEGGFPLWFESGARGEEVGGGVATEVSIEIESDKNTIVDDKDDKSFGDFSPRSDASMDLPGFRFDDYDSDNTDNDNDDDNNDNQVIGRTRTDMLKIGRLFSLPQGRFSPGRDRIGGFSSSECDDFSDGVDSWAPSVDEVMSQSAEAENFPSNSERHVSSPEELLIEVGPSDEDSQQRPRRKKDRDASSRWFDAGPSDEEDWQREEQGLEEMERHEWGADQLISNDAASGATGGDLCLARSDSSEGVLGIKSWNRFVDNEGKRGAANTFGQFRVGIAPPDFQRGDWVSFEVTSHESVDKDDDEGVITA